MASDPNMESRIDAASAEMNLRVIAMERTLRGYNGNIGLVADVRDVQKTQGGMREDLAMQWKIVCDPEKGLVTKVVVLEHFAEDAAKFIEDFRGLATKLFLAVLGTVLGGVLLQVVINYIFSKGAIP